MSVRRHRVAVTGMGVVSPIGSTVGSFEAALRGGVSGGGPITLFDPASLPTRIAAQVREPLDALAGRGGLPELLAREGNAGGAGDLCDRKVIFALAAAAEAMASARACGSAPPEDLRAGLSLGIGLELFSMEDLIRMRRPGFALPATRLGKLTYLQTPSDMAVGLLAYQYRLGAVPQVHVSACAAGTDAVGAAFRLVASGRRRWMLAGGTDSMINPMGVAGFCKVQATTTANDRPAHASRPFDRERDGFLLGEGAGMLVLERLEDARARGATVYAEVTGYGNSFDAFGISEPHPEGRGAYQAMARALADAELGPERVDAINAHGTSTPKNDRIETLAIKRLLGERAAAVPISATKSMIGHLISAAGAVEAIAAILGLRGGWVHPTINLVTPDAECDLDYVPGEARRHAQGHVLSSSFAFGGQNAAIVLRNASHEE